MKRDSRRRGDWYLGFPSEGKGCHLRLKGARVLSFLDVSGSAILDWARIHNEKGKYTSQLHEAFCCAAFFSSLLS